MLATILNRVGYQLCYITRTPLIYRLLEKVENVPTLTATFTQSEYLVYDSSMYHINTSRYYYYICLT